MIGQERRDQRAVTWGESRRPGSLSARCATWQSRPTSSSPSGATPGSPPPSRSTLRYPLDEQREFKVGFVRFGRLFCTRRCGSATRERGSDRAAGRRDGREPRAVTLPPPPRILLGQRYRPSDRPNRPTGKPISEPPAEIGHVQANPKMFHYPRGSRAWNDATLSESRSPRLWTISTRGFFGRTVEGPGRSRLDDPDASRGPPGHGPPVGGETGPGRGPTFELSLPLPRGTRRRR